MDSFFAKIFGSNEQVRLPHFAGTWYPSQPAVLEKNLSGYLKEVKIILDNAGSGVINDDKANSHKNILAIIAPHAGYEFSGRTAAYAYDAISSHKYKRVFLLGPSHHIAFRGIVFPSENLFDTPLGQLQVDQSTVQRLLRKPYFDQSNAVFEIEHSLEMQLPWIKKTLSKVQLIPMAVGILGQEEMQSIAQSIKNELMDGDLLIVSSDFTHYGPRFAYEPFSHDSRQISVEAKIKELDIQAFQCLKSLDSQILMNFYNHTGDTICGIYPAALLLYILPPQTNAYLLNYSTSQDFEKDIAGNAVSYMSIIFSTNASKNFWKTNKKSTSKTQTAFSQSEGKALLKIARLCLEDYLKGEKKDPSEYTSILESNHNSLLANGGVFVTLYKKTGEIKKEDSMRSQSVPKQLRGCMGYIYPNKPLLIGLCENAVNAATNDPRFNPITLSELHDLIIEISLLSIPHYISDWKNINLGVDGIVLHKSGKQAVFLPKVATEFGWDLPQTLSELSVKAGLSPSDWRYDAQFEVFQSQSFSE